MPDGLPALRGPTDAASAEVVTLPNAISLARLCLVPAVIWLVLHQQAVAACWLFALAGLSDAFDGWLARRRGPTALGAVLDPVADKVLLVSLYVALAAVRALPDWLAMLVVFRDLLIVGGVLTLSFLGHAVPIRPLLVSKVNTVLQILLVLLTLLRAAYGADAGGIDPFADQVLVWLVAASTVASGVAYVWQRAHAR